MELERTPIGKRRSPATFLAALWTHLKEVSNKLGHFAKVCSSDGPPGAEASKLFRGDDLLPIEPKEVASYLLDDGQVIADSVQGMVAALNYLALCSGNAPVPEELPDRPLTKPQERVVDHLRKAVSYLEESGQVVRSFAFGGS